MADATSTPRILTLPNVITLARLACLPVFLWLLFGRENRAAAAWLLAALGATDWVDGYLARRMHQVSELGKILDPVADRLLFIVGAGGILVDGSVPVWFAVVVLVRETLVGGTTIVLGMFGARRIDVTWFGKAGTFMLMVAGPTVGPPRRPPEWPSRRPSASSLPGGRPRRCSGAGPTAPDAHLTRCVAGASRSANGYPAPPRVRSGP